MNELFDPKHDDSMNRSSAHRKGICPSARISPTDYQTSDKRGPGPFMSTRPIFGEHRLAMITAYSLVILAALGYVPGLSL